MSNGPLDVPLEQGGLPAELKSQIIERGSRSLEGLVDEPHREEAVRRVVRSLPIATTSTSQMEITATQHVGPVPAPETVEHYERIVPGSANRMIEMAERDQQAFIASNKRAQWLDFSFNIIALIGGGGGLIAILWAAIHLAEGGHENVAVALVGLGVSGVVGAFVNARWKKSL